MRRDTLSPRTRVLHRASPNDAAENTFWEKATAIHAFVIGGRLPGDAIARHWLDLHHLSQAGTAAAAAADFELAQQVADHKKLFIKVSIEDGPVDYHREVTGGLRVVPVAEKLEQLAEDYQRMVEAQLPHGESAPDFEPLVPSREWIECEVNRTAGGSAG